MTTTPEGFAIDSSPIKLPKNGIQPETDALRSALADAENRCETQCLALEASNARLREIVVENESLAFRNGQLLKRVETLQHALDNNNAALQAGGKSKKKYNKEANLRFFGENSRQPIFSAVDPVQVMEQELERNLTENSVLHSKIFDMEKEHKELVGDFELRVEQLEKENARLRRLVETQGVCAALVAPSPRAGNAKLSRDESSNGAKASGGNAFSCGASNAEDCESLSALVDEAETNRATMPSLADTISDLLLEVHNHHHQESDTGVASHHLLETIKNLSSSLRHATGRAEYFKQECECLVRKSLLELDAKAQLEANIAQLETKCAHLKDALDSTRENYESQMCGLYEHMAEQDSRIVQLSERLGEVSIVDADDRNNNKDGNAAAQQLNGNSKAGTGGGRNGRKVSATQRGETSIGKNLRRIVGK